MARHTEELTEEWFAMLYISKNPNEAISVVQTYGHGANKRVVLKCIDVIPAAAALDLGRSMCVFLKADEEVAIALVHKNGKCLQDIPYWCQTQEVVLTAVRNNGYALRWAIKKPPLVVLAAVAQNGRALRHASDADRLDHSIVEAALGSYGSAIHDLPPQMVTRENIMRAIWDKDVRLVDLPPLWPPLSEREAMYAVSAKGLRIVALREFADSERVCMCAAASDGQSVQFMSVAQRDNPKVVINAVRHNFKAFQYASTRLRSDLDFLAELAQVDGRALAFASVDIDELIAQSPNIYATIGACLPVREDVIRDAVGRDGRVIEYVNASDRDTELISLAIDTYPACVRLLNASQMTTALLEKAVRRDGLLISAFPRLQTRSVCKEAVAENGFALKFVTEEYRIDAEVTYIAIDCQPMALEHAHDTYRGDPVLVMRAVKKNGLALKFAAERVRANPQVAFAAVENTPFALPYCARREPVLRLIARVHVAEDVGDAIREFIEHEKTYAREAYDVLESHSTFACTALEMLKTAVDRKHEVLSSISIDDEQDPACAYLCRRPPERGTCP